MLQSQKLELRRSEVRGKLNELNATQGQFSDEQRTEFDALNGELADLEKRWRTAVELENAEAERRQSHETGDAGESAELRRLSAKAEARHYVAAAISGNGLAGELAEYNSSMGLPTVGPSGGVILPIERLRPMEERADAATTTSKLAGPETQQPIMQQIFGADIKGQFGAQAIAVPAGRTEFALIDGKAAPAMKAEGTARDDAPAAEFSAELLKPLRLTKAFFGTHEFLGEVPGAEAALRRNLSDSANAEMTKLFINGNGTAPQPKGLLGVLSAPGNASAEAGFQTYASLASQGVDGIHATMQSQVCALFGIATYKHAASAYVSAGSGEVSGLDRLSQNSKGVYASSFMPAVASKNQEVILFADGSPMANFASPLAIWPSLEIVRDIYSQASTGVLLTYVMLWNVKAAHRAGAYTRTRLQIEK